jgi:hypothetical protein
VQGLIVGCVEKAPQRTGAGLQHQGVRFVITRRESPMSPGTPGDMENNAVSEPMGSA